MITINPPDDATHVNRLPAADIFGLINATSMNIPAFTKDATATRKTAASQPTAAVVMPFNPKMTPKHDLEAAVKRIIETVEKTLLATHPSEVAMPALKHLQQGLRSLNYSTHKRSVAVFASAETNRTTYMDFPVEERIIIDTPFRVRDLADCKPAGKEYLLLLLSGTQSKMYLKTGSGLRLIKSNTAQNIYAWLNEPPTRTGNFSDPDAWHEVMLNKFMHHMDEGLDAVLRIYPLPVFVAGVERIAGHFAAITRHQRNIAGYLYKHCMDCNEAELEEMLRPRLDNWRQLRQRLLLLQLEKAAEAGKLACGIDEVRKAARCSNSRLVVIERTADTAGKETSGTFYTEGIIDQLVEKVLENGGDVEKLDQDLPGKYGPIALIRYY